jgi:hypothetical protein
MFDVVWGDLGWFAASYIKPYHDEILAVATIFIAVFTIVLACVARRQITLTKVLERAYISVRPFGIETFRTKDNVVCLIAIRNSGRTPARKVSWVLCRKWDTERRLEKFQINNGDFVGNNIIPAGEEIIKGTGPIEIEEFGKIIKTTPQIYVWGAIRYYSGFGLWHHTTRFCHRYDCTGVTADETGIYTVSGQRRSSSRIRQ